MIPIDALEHTAGFAHLKRGDQLEVAKRMRLLRYSPDERIMTRKSAVDGAFILLSGDAINRRRLIPQPSRDVAEVQPRGSWFAIVPLLDRQPALNTVQAVSEVEVACLSRSDYEALLRDPAGTGARLLQSWIRDIAEEMRLINQINVRMRAKVGA